jgi:hypothetical protein
VEEDMWYVKENTWKRRCGREDAKENMWMRRCGKEYVNEKM